GRETSGLRSRRRERDPRRSGTDPTIATELCALRSPPGGRIPRRFRDPLDDWAWVSGAPSGSLHFWCDNQIRNRPSSESLSAAGDESGAPSYTFLKTSSNSPCKFGSASLPRSSANLSRDAFSLPDDFVCSQKMNALLYARSISA